MSQFVKFGAFSLFFGIGTCITFWALDRAMGWPSHFGYHTVLICNWFAAWWGMCVGKAA